MYEKKKKLLLFERNVILLPFLWTILVLCQTTRGRDEFTPNHWFYRTHAALSEVPDNIPKRAVRIYLNNNKISRIWGLSFAHHSVCKWGFEISWFRYEFEILLWISFCQICQHWSFSKWRTFIEITFISVNSRNFINHWNMNWAQFKDPGSHKCLARALVAYWYLTQEVTGSSPFNDKYF